MPATALDHPLLTGTPYAGYAYSYPHKSAYRAFDPAVPLRELWTGEDRSALFLYLHVPFCEYRCGFCNLFTRSNPAADLPARYLVRVRREAERVRDTIGDASFVRLAVGGGTPTFLDAEQLAELFALCTDVMGADPAEIPVSVECSPATIDAGKLRLLRDRGIDRISIGVQTFDDAESKHLGRPQTRVEAERALDLLRSVEFPVLNVDLVYGGDGQTIDSWLQSVRDALRYRPEELYLYPLYVRPRTGLGRRSASEPPLREAGNDWDEFRLAAYGAARDLLLGEGYEQVSMRMFRTSHAPDLEDPPYRCQEDGMVGLGCGSRSYTDRLHYSGEYAVGQTGVKAILGDYLSRPAESFESARHGIRLTEEDRRRRFVILSLLQTDGLASDDFRRRFGGDPFTEFPELTELVGLGLAVHEDGRLALTAAGMERSDAIGPWLYSDRVKRLSEASQCR